MSWGTPVLCICHLHPDGRAWLPDCLRDRHQYNFHDQRLCWGTEWFRPCGYKGGQTQLIEHVEAYPRPDTSLFQIFVIFCELSFSYVSSKLEVMNFTPGCQYLDLLYLQRASTDCPFWQHQQMDCQQRMNFQQRQPESRSAYSPSVLNSYQGHAGLIYFHYGLVEIQVYKFK